MLYGLCMAFLAGGLKLQESLSSQISLIVVAIIMIIRLVSKLSNNIGFSNDPAVHSLPDDLSSVFQKTIWNNRESVAQKGSFSVSDCDRMDGHTFEAFCADLLRKNGVEKVITTKGSGDQGVDIIAEKDGIRYAIQCKCYSSDLGNKPIQEVYTGKNIYRCQIGAVMTNRRFTPGGIEAAKATGVLLWDRRKLQQFIDNANR